MSVSECEEDFDCEGPRLCYINVSWLLEDGIQSQCGCGTWNSYVGEDCLEFGPGAYYLVTSAIVTGALALFGFLVSMRVLSVDFPGIRKLTLDSRATTNIYTCLGFLGVCFWRGVVAYKAFTPENIDFAITENLNENRKTHNSRVYELVSIGITLIFALLAILNISLSWIATVDRVAKLNTAGAERAVRYKLLIVLFEVVLITVSIVLSPISAALQTYAVGFIMLFVCALYVYGLCRLLPLLESSISATFSRENPKYLSLVKLIKRSAAILLSGVAIGLAGGAAYASISLFNGGWREKTPPGTVSSALITNELLPFGTVLALHGVEYFIYNTTYISSQTSEIKSKLPASTYI